MNRQAVIIAVIAIILAAGVAWWFYETFEYRSEEKDIGFHGEARRNPYLAAERFLEKFGMEIKSLPTILDLKTMPENRDVLFIPTDRYDLAPEKIDELLEWVKQGGHLIVRARYVRKETKMHDELFDRLGVETHINDDRTLFEDAEQSLVDVHVNKNIENKQVNFDSDIWLQDTAENEISWQVDGDNGSHLLEYSMGNGFVTLLSDIEFIQNEMIDEHDHASFLYTVVHIDNTNRKLWIIRHDDMPSIFSIVRDRAPEAIAVFVVFIVLWLWYTTRRFGPILPGEKPVRRSLREHITSSGFYQWRNHHRTELFISARTALHEQIAQTRPLWAKLDEMKLASKLGKIAGIPSDRILLVLKANKADKESEFSQYIEILSVIRKKL